MVLNTNDVFEAMNEAVQKSTSVSKKFKVRQVKCQEINIRMSSGLN